MRSAILNASFKTMMIGSVVLAGLATQIGVASAQDAAPAETAAAADTAATPLIDLSLYPAGGATLEQAAYDLLIADPAAAGNIETLLASATPEQKMAIGAAFGRAVADLSAEDPDAAEPILLVVSEVTDIDFLTSFAAGSGDAATAALGEGGAGGFSFNSASAGAPFTVNGSSGVGNAGAGETIGDPSANGAYSYSFGTIAESSVEDEFASGSISPTTP